MLPLNVPASRSRVPERAVAVAAGSAAAGFPAAVAVVFSTGTRIGNFEYKL